MRLLLRMCILWRLVVYGKYFGKKFLYCCLCRCKYLICCCGVGGVLDVDLFGCGGVVIIVCGGI